MNRDTEFDRLRETYAAQDDEQLLHAWDQRESFTELAQEAIESVMNSRGLSKDAGEVVPGGLAELNGEESAAGLDEDEVGLHRFGDMFELSRALDLLDEADIPHRVVEYRQLQEGIPGILVVVRQRDEAAAQELLRARMGLFPGAEIADGNGDSLSAGDFMLLAMFERKEALVAAQTLGEAGISYLWRDGKEETNDLPDEETVAIEVRSAQMERATRLVEG